MEEKDKNQKYEALKRFFRTNSRIKESLIRIAPESLDDYSVESRIEYTHKLLEELKEFEYEFLEISKDFGFGAEVDKALKQKFREIKKNFAIYKYDNGVGADLYRTNFSNMNENLIEKIKYNFVGYTFLNPSKLAEFIRQANSVNELLHVFHSYIINNENIINSMPIIKTKLNDGKYPINWYGEETDFSRNLFERFPMEMDVGYTDIVSMKNKIIMMVRDRGHALTIDIDDLGDEVIIKYFIPKLCNREMIKKLPGINKISERTATGMVQETKDKACETLFDFIEKVPMDSDIPRYEYVQVKREIFSIEDSKELAMESGENGRRISSIRRTGEKFKNTIGKLIQRFSKEKGEEIDDNSSRDE